MIPKSEYPEILKFKNGGILKKESKLRFPYCFLANFTKFFFEEVHVT